MESNVFYTLLKDDNTEDGVGELWSYEQAMAHVRRCAWEVNDIKYTLVEHNVEHDIEENSLQQTQPKKRGRRSSKSSPSE